LEGRAMGSDRNAVLLVALAASSVAFGILHVSNGSGWAIGKLPEATFGGLVLGYLYIRYGLHMAVLTHWGIDYLGTVFAFFGQGAYGIPWGSSPGYILQQVTTANLSWSCPLDGNGCPLVGIPAAGIGLLSVILVAYAGLRRLRRPTNPGTGLLQ